MTRRYYVTQLPEHGGPVDLPDAEAQHASRVMRAKVGDTITLFDGNGVEANATIESIDRRSCLCHAASPVSVNREPEIQLHLGVALPKPDRAKELIERLTELGVHRVTPLVCNRSQRPPSPGLIEKLQRVVVEACKQCGRNHLLGFAPVTTAQEFFAMQHPQAKWITHPGGAPLGVAWESLEDKRLTAAVGPEGGFDESEVAQATAGGFIMVDLGSRIYRIETAAVVVAARL